MKEYKYDIAFSLCKEDADFARNLIAQLNPSIKIFFYESNQEEIINTSGPETFAKIFKEDSRVVIILSRKEWSESYYTDIERNAIIDRTAIKNQGYNFLFIIPIVPDEIPAWYPSTRIYANPQRFSIELLAKFIEFKVSEEGGLIQPLSLEDRYQHLLNKIEEKKKILKLQYEEVAISEIQLEIEKIKATAKSKTELLQNSIIGDHQIQTWSTPDYELNFKIHNYLLSITVTKPNEVYQKISTTQDYSLRIRLFEITGTLQNLYAASNNKALKREFSYKFIYTPTLKGWAVPYTYSQTISQRDTMVLFSFKDPDSLRETRSFYDLKNPVSSEELIDNAFQLLLDSAANSISRYL